MIRYKKLKISFESQNNLILGRKKILFWLCSTISNFSRNFMKISWKFEKFWKTKNFELRNFWVSVICQFLCRFFSNFFESTRNGLIDGRKNAGAYKIVQKIKDFRFNYVCTSVLKLIYHGANPAVHLLLFLRCQSLATKIEPCLRSMQIRTNSFLLLESMNLCKITSGRFAK